MGRQINFISYVACAGLLCITDVGHARSDDELRQLSSEVKALRTLTDLNLSKEQLSQLQTLSVQAVELRKAHEKELEALKSDAMAELQARKERLLSGETDGTKGRKQKGRSDGRYRELRSELREKAAPLGEAALQLLTPEQKEQLEQVSQGGHHRRGFHGDAMESGHRRGGFHGDAMESVLERARNLDDSEYATARARILERHQRLLEERGVDSSDIAAQSSKLGTTLDEARAMSDAEFEAKKSELASELRPKRSDSDKLSGADDDDARHRPAAVMAAWLSRESTLRALEALQGK